MKKLIFVVLIMMSAIVGFSQVDTSNYKYEANSENSKYSLIQSKKAFNGRDSGEVEAGLTWDLSKDLDYTTMELSRTDSVVAHTDSVTRLFDLADTSNSFKNNFKIWYQLSIISNDDTIEISPLVTFPANKTKALLPNQSWTSAKKAVKSFTQYFIRRKGTTGTANYTVNAEGY